MIRIGLFCATGTSTSVLVSKMKNSAEEIGIEAEIFAYPEGQISKYLNGLDIALLGPHVAYSLPKAREACAEAGVPIAVISAADFGMLNGKRVLEFALEEIGEK